MNKDTKRLIGFTTWEIVGIISVLVLIIAVPYLFTQFSLGVSFEKTGQIGDTIGGITAPFVNLLAAYLVYKSFSAQIQANANQREDHNKQMEQIRKEYQFNYIRDLYTLISSDYWNNANNEEDENWVESLVNLADSFSDPNSYGIYNNFGDFKGRKSNDEIQDIINDHSISKLETILLHVNNIKIFANAIRGVSLETGLIEYYTLRIEEIIKDSKIWLLLDKDVQKILDKNIIFYEYQKIEIEYIIKSIKEIKDMDFKVNPF